jgi:APA family basic amino acid/polyamine antiporter
MSWRFVGIESATAPAGSVKNPQEAIQNEIVMGTACVAIIYILNMTSVIGVTGFEPLLNLKAPYAAAIKSLDSLDIEILMSIIAIVVCARILNACTLASSRIASGAASDKLFPEIFRRLNKRGAPVYALLMAARGLLLFFIGEQIIGIDGLNYLLDLICGVFLFAYMFSMIGSIKMVKRWKKRRLIESDRIFYCSLHWDFAFLRSFLVL